MTEIADRIGVGLLTVGITGPGPRGIGTGVRGSVGIMPERPGRPGVSGPMPRKSRMVVKSSSEICWICSGSSFKMGATTGQTSQIPAKL